MTLPSWLGPGVDAAVPRVLHRRPRRRRPAQMPRAPRRRSQHIELRAPPPSDAAPFSQKPSPSPRPLAPRFRTSASASIRASNSARRRRPPHLLQGPAAARRGQFSQKPSASPRPSTSRFPGVRNSARSSHTLQGDAPAVASIASAFFGMQQHTPQQPITAPTNAMRKGTPFV